MLHVLRKLSAKFASKQDEVKRQTYFDMMKSEGWKYHVENLMYLRGIVAEDMLSERFTVLKPLEKDSAQRAYAMVDQVILYLINPMAEASRLSTIMAHNAKIQGATTKGATAKEGK
jgi:hypothetical protein